ncbi:hypothetical protein LCGC14_1227000 [marine sediment metagenome]|uniref:DNA polymerase III beta sliding clamp C-terminal domain-containing protein n=1 Tax=marine sediment metagenome TaxID=412755 RepID=A0A0F9LDP2_9ZZZZ
MSKEIRVLRENVIKTLTGIKEDNVSIAGIAIPRRTLLEALKLQTQPGGERLTLTYGAVSWQDKTEHGGISKVTDKAAIQISCDHTTMRFFDNPKLDRRGISEFNTIPLNFIDYRDYVKPELTGIPLDTLELIKALAFTLPCTAKEISRPPLECILFESGKGILKLAAADGFRLAVTELPAAGIPKYKALIHHTDIVKLQTFLKAIPAIGTGKNKYYSEVYLSYSGDVVRFAHEKASIDFTRHDLNFPDYPQLIPKEGIKSEFIASDMLRAAKSINGVTRDGSGIIRLNFKTYKTVSGKITLSAASAEVGDNSAVCDAIVEKDCRIAVNVSYLTAFLKLCGDNKISIKLTNSSSPMVFETPDNRLEVIMPMFVQWDN